MQHQNLRKILQRQYRLAVVLALVLCMGVVGTAAATTTSSSPNYSVTETQFGAGASLQDCSDNYCAKTSVGDTAVGNTKSDNYGAYAGANTTDEPYLAVSVIGGTQDMGVLDDTHTGTAVDTIDVTTYLSNGYAIQIAGASPSQGTHNLRVPMGPGNTPFTSQQGNEQFGINLVANTTPALGADPVSQPDGTDLLSTVIPSRYSNSNEFAYIDSDIVAQSGLGNGEIDYTLSMIINVSDVTPGGRYQGVYSAVVTPTF